ncbi:MAG: hypothetical protein A4E43_00103 [Methanosaeta sp. PtaB.Bin005]|nr:MAG: hypothetical protein A4E43_00103 [Methanosaeta sp. PtaB.Bin005]
MEYTVAFDDISLILIESGVVEGMGHGLHKNPGRFEWHHGIFINCNDIFYSGED